MVVAMLILYRGDSRSQAPSLIEKPDSSQPDFASLVDILIVLAPPDAAGEINITSEEASRIRDVGWFARKGVWRAPLIPWRFIAPFPNLWVLDDQTDPDSRPACWRPKRTAFIRPETSPDDASKRERQLLRLLQRNGRLSRTQLQQRVSYLISTPILDFLLERLLARERIAISDDGWIYPASPAL
jgi:hypothetical protein